MVEVPAAATRHGWRRVSAAPPAKLRPYTPVSPDSHGPLDARLRWRDHAEASFLNELESRSQEHDKGPQEYDRLDPELSRLWRVTPNHGTQPLQCLVAETLFPPPMCGDKPQDR